METRVLVVDDDGLMRMRTTRRLRNACLSPQPASDVDAALSLAQHRRAEILVVHLPLPGADDLAVVRRLALAPELEGCRILVVLPGAAAHETAALLHAGADAVLGTPWQEGTLEARIRSLLRKGEVERMLQQTFGRRPEAAIGLAEEHAAFRLQRRMALITHSAESATAWQARLGPALPHGFQALRVEDAVEHLARLPAHSAPELHLIESDLRPGSPGLSLMLALGHREAAGAKSFCLLCAPGTDPLAATVSTCLDLGADEIMHPAMGPAEIQARLATLARHFLQSERKRSRAQGEMRLALFDPLTGIHNRRHALSRLTQISRDSREQRYSHAVLLLDIDHFKQVNDTHGHKAGDQVLIAVCRRLQAALAPGDLLARMGGDEFLIALPRCCPETAMRRAEALRQAVTGPALALESGQILSLSLSIGVALGTGGQGHIAPAGCITAEDDPLLEAADRALLRAKATGRNRIELAPPASQPALRPQDLHGHSPDQAKPPLYASRSRG